MSYWTNLNSKRANRRRFIAGGTALSLGAAAMAIGCGSDEESSSTANAAPKYGGTMLLGTTTQVTSFEPHVTLSQHYGTTWQVWEHLTAYDEDLKIQPRTVEKWEIQNDFTTVVLHLRPGVKWHTGRAFTGEDIKWNILRARDPAVPAGVYRQMSGWYTTMETPDPQTLVLKSQKPAPGTFDFFEQFSIMDPVTNAEKGLTTAVGTGPFKFLEWKQGVSFKLVKNPEYWDKSLPYLDGLNWTEALDEQTAAAQVETGAVHFVENVAIPVLTNFKDKSGFQSIVARPHGNYYVAGMNVSKPPFDDKRVRQAINWTLDRQRFIRLNLSGLGVAKSLPWPPESPAYEEKKDKFYNTQDLKKAADLLKAAGITSLDCEVIPSPTKPELVDFGQVMAADLAQLGIKLSVRVLDVALYSDAINKLQYNGLGTYNTGRAGLGSPATLFSSAPHIWGGVAPNNTGYRDAEMQAWIDQVVVEPDPQKAKSIYSQINDRLLDSGHNATLSESPIRYIANNKVKDVGYALYASWIHRNSWLDA